MLVSSALILHVLNAQSAYLGTINPAQGQQIVKSVKKTRMRPLWARSRVSFVAKAQQQAGCKDVSAPANVSVILRIMIWG